MLRGVLLAAIAVLILAGSSGARRGEFANYSLAQSRGVVCPGSAKCKNPAAEPAIRADRAGEFFGSSENGLGERHVALRSTDGGLPLHDARLAEQRFADEQHAASRRAAATPTSPLRLTGTRPARYNVYVSSLSLANIDVSTSTDARRDVAVQPGHDAGDDRRPRMDRGRRSARRSASATTTPRREHHVGCSHRRRADVYPVRERDRRESRLPDLGERDRQPRDRPELAR